MKNKNWGLTFYLTKHKINIYCEQSNMFLSCIKKKIKDARKKHIYIILHRNQTDE